MKQLESTVRQSRLYRYLIGAVLALALIPTAAHAQQAAPCQFVLGFKTLHDLGAVDVGDCTDNQAFAPNGDAQQHTTKGLMAWRKADNWTAFTDGYMTWINGPNGLVSRLNTDRFPWEGDRASAPAQAHVGPTAAYPNSATTPGATDPRVTQDDIQQTICVSGYTKTIRPPVSFTEPLKLQQIAAYGYADTNPRDYEEDHFVPLEVGGAPADPKNLWPEPYSPTPGAHEKDKTEGDLHREVCSGTMTLAAAQQAIESDWVAVYQQMGGSISPSAPAATVVSSVAPTSAPSGGQIVCNDGYVWPTTTRRGACSRHGGIAPSH